MEDPDCVVEVDTTKPIVSLLTPSLGDNGVMTIGWTAADENLLSNLINLYYAPKPAGPWKIVSGYKNTGEYPWPPGGDDRSGLPACRSCRPRRQRRPSWPPTPVALEVGKHGSRSSALDRLNKVQ